MSSQDIVQGGVIYIMAIITGSKLLPLLHYDRFNIPGYCKTIIERHCGAFVFHSAFIYTFKILILA